MRRSGVAFFVGMAAMAAAAGLPSRLALTGIVVGIIVHTIGELWQCRVAGTPIQPCRRPKGSTWDCSASRPVQRDRTHRTGTLLHRLGGSRLAPARRGVRGGSADAVRRAVGGTDAPVREAARGTGLVLGHKRARCCCVDPRRRLSAGHGTHHAALPGRRDVSATALPGTRHRGQGTDPGRRAGSRPARHLAFGSRRARQRCGCAPASCSCACAPPARRTAAPPRGDLPCVADRRMAARRDEPTRYWLSNLPATPRTAPGPPGETPLAHRARLPRDQDRPRPGPLRRPHLARLAPPRHPRLRRPRLLTLQRLDPKTPAPE